MLKILVARSIGLIPVLLGIAVVTFFAVRLVPGDPVHVMLGDAYTEELAAPLRKELGLDRGIIEQFILWFGNLLQGDLGTSVRSREPVLAEILDRFPATLMLAVGALAVSLLIAIPMGVVAARKPNGALDSFTRVLTVGLMSVPSFVFALVLILIFSVHLRWFPSMGMAPEGSSLLTTLSFLVLPALCLGLEMIAVTSKMTRTSVLEVAGRDFIRTARSKGLPRSRVTRSHLLRNALIPVVTVVGIQVGSLVGGTVVVEQVFSWPGLGSLLVRSIVQRDYPMVQGAVMFLALTFVIASFIADILYTLLDPRLRRG